MWEDSPAPHQTNHHTSLTFESAYDKMTFARGAHDSGFAIAAAILVLADALKRNRGSNNGL